MTTLQAALIERADSALGTAHRACELDDDDCLVDRVRLACFYFAQAALIRVGEKPRTHTGTNRRFLLHFVANGPLDRQLGAVLLTTHDLRRRLLRDPFARIDSEAADVLLADAERFVAAVRGLVEAGR